MAAKVIDWVWEHSRAVNSPLIVLLAIAHESDRDGNAEMGVLELSRKTRLSKRAVVDAIAVLVARGELEVRSAGGGRGRRSGYRVPVKGADPAPFEPGNGADPAPFSETVQILHPSGPGLNGADPAPFSGHRPSSDHASPVKGADSAPLQISDVFVSSTGIEEVQVKDVPAIAERADVERLCAHLADRIEANGSKRPTISKRWRDAARLMIDRDGRTEQKIHAAVDWCQDSEFWRANIMSMPKLREKYDQLRLQATRKPSGSRQAETDALFDAAMTRAKVREGQK